MKITVERDIHKDEMLIGLSIPLRQFDYDKEIRDRLEYLMLRVATSPAEGSELRREKTLVEALLYVVSALKDKEESNRASNLLGGVLGQSAQMGVLNTQFLQSSLGSYAAGGPVAPNNPPPKPDIYSQMMKVLKDKT